MLSNSRALKPLIFTGRSDTNDKAMRRYFSTLLHVMTWYEGDVWDPNDPAHKDVLSIRSIHNKVAQLVNSSRNHEKVKNIKVTDKGHVEPECPYYPSIREDMRRVAENALDHQESSQPLTYLNQLDMSLTQYSFFGLLVAHPKKLGAGAATEEEFEGLIHFWRGIGWLLGIDDKYNFCSGNLAETRALCLEVEKFFAIPWLASADWDHEHMTTCIMSGMNTLIFGLSFPSMFRYLTHVLDVPAPEFESRLSFVHTLQYWLLRFVFALILVIPSLVIILNRLFKNLVEMVQNESNKPKSTDKQDC
ncbi:uncharacterized protein LOC135204182 [Macrobrachium nipponense]|uniref:uncharacterized protein LOC135204182 n=1 Tax=Macrobrachium nipponense TaxID=159736 RepID=UPI0030C86F56